FTVCQKRYTLAYEKLKEYLISTEEKVSQIEIRYTFLVKIQIVTGEAVMRVLVVVFGWIWAITL
ncbi:hypothetical protein MKT19_008030, partial [Providencia rettgeri]|nr:hypothetical protein [Providencia rettgeri]